MHLLYRLLPLLGTAGLLYYFFHDKAGDFDRFYTVLQSVDMSLVWPGVLFPAIAFLLSGTFLQTFYLARLHKGIPLKKFIPAQAVINLLVLVNMGLWMGGSFYYQKRVTQISWKKLAGLNLFSFAVTSWSAMLVVIPATIIWNMQGLHRTSFMDPYLWWGILLLPGVLLCGGTILFFKWGLDPTRIGRLIVKERHREFWTAFREFGFREVLVGTVITVPMISIYFAVIWQANQAFGIDIPAAEFVVTIGPASMINGLPIATGGFGTTTLSWFVFYSAYASEEAILAYTLFIPFARAVMRILLGIICLPFVSRAMLQKALAEAETHQP